MSVQYGKNVFKSKIAEKFILYMSQVRHYNRYRESRWLGYYKGKLPTPDYREREAKYRKEVLRPLEEIPSLEERLKGMKVTDPVLDKKIDIGFAVPVDQGISIKERLKWRREMKEKKLEYISEDHISLLDLAEVTREWRETSGLEHLKDVADHYSIFSHLYKNGYFTPCLPLTVTYDYDADTVTFIYMGNILQASEASKEPNVSYNSKPSDLWTLVLSNLDGHLLDTHSEYLHWMIGNIKGNDLQSGQVLCNYLQPFPMRGSGYHRLVFVLYKQHQEIDFSAHKKSSPCLSLEERTFKTYDFYKKFQDAMTPAGLAFYQCIWDESLTDFFHNVLNMQEPVFEYVEPPVYVKPQVHYPHLEPFNMYLDRYRDPKEMKKEILLKRLQNVHPFQEEAPMPKYPCLHKADSYRHTWQKRGITLERLRLGKYRDLRPHSVYPQEDDQYTPWHKI